MKVENMNKVIAWLEAGAPHAYFDMEYGVEDVYDDFFNQHYSIYKDVPKKEDCNTVCCIAGAAALMSYAEDNQLKTVFPENHVDMRWDEIEDRALCYLGLPKDDIAFGNQLFSHEIAPENCTPKEAAEAMKRLLKGEKAWI
jgi:hypothetical protein